MIARLRWEISVLGASFVLASSAAAQGECISASIERQLETCSSAPGTRAPRRPGHGELPTGRTPARTIRTAPPAPQGDIGELLEPTHPARARETNLLLRERAILERLAARTAPSAPNHADVLRRLAETCAELLRVRQVEARELDEPIFRARQSGQSPAELVRRQRAAERNANGERERAVRALVQLVREHPQDRQLDEGLYALAYHLERMDRRPQAREVYHRLVRDFPQSRYVPHAYLAFAEHFFREGQLDEARQFYERVIAIPPERNPLHVYARYKLAWVHFNVEAFRQSLEELVHVIEQVRTGASPDGRSLGRQARREIALPYARVGQPNRALAFFRRIADDEDDALAMLERLAELYLDTGRWAETITVHRELMTERPQHASLCLWQARVLDATISSRPKPEQVREARRLMDVRVQHAARHPAALARACDERVASTLVLLATAWHREAVGTESEPGTRDRNTLSFASDLYALIENGLPNLDGLSLPEIDARDRPTRAQSAYFHGELLFELARWAECADAYARALAASPSSALAVDASYGVVLCYDRRLGERRPPPTPSDRALTARELTTDEARMAEAFARFSCVAQNHEELPVVLYRRARIYYEANQFERAALLFRRVALEFPDSEVAAYAANLHLDSLNVLAQRRGRQACYAVLSDSLNALTPPLCGSDEARAAHSDFCTVSEHIRCDLEASRADALGRAGEHVPSARKWLELVTRYRGCPDEPTYLYNAAIQFEAARLLGRAIRVRISLIEAHPDHALARAAIYLVGANYHALALYAQAAEFYENYARTQGSRAEPCQAADRSDCPDAAEGLRHAVVFRFGLGERDAALADARLFKQLFRRERPAMSAEVDFAVGAFLEGEARDTDVIAHYRTFLREYARTARADQLARANVSIARAYVRQGDRARAEPHLRAAIELHANSGDDAFSELAAEERTLAVMWLRDAASEALYEQAEARRERFEAMAFPRLRGRPSIARVERWAHDELAPWLASKVEALRSAEEGYDRVHVLGIPRWRIASASRVGDMVMRIVDDVRGSPVPAEIANDPELLDLYWDELERAVGPHEQAAIVRYERCLRTATDTRFFDSRSRRCEEALNRLDSARFPVASELRGRPDLVPPGIAEPAAVRLDG